MTALSDKLNMPLPFNFLQEQFVIEGKVFRYAIVKRTLLQQKTLATIIKVLFYRQQLPFH